MCISFAARFRITPRAKRVIETAMAGCANMGKKYVGTEHLLIGILSEGDNYAIRFINELGVDAAALTTEALKASGIDPEDTQSVNAAGTASDDADSKAPTLVKYGRDLTAAAKKGKIDPVIGREKEIERVIQILCRRTKNTAGTDSWQKSDDRWLYMASYGAPG